jgi:DNA-binding SARP family transcriptional activator
MSHATQADADPNTWATRMARESPQLAQESSRVEETAPGMDAKRPIRIHTLGQFSIAIDDRALRSKGKAKHRPLALLKALVALGGREVSSSRLCECLWPDSDGDLGARNLTITLHRLRSLLQAKAAVVSVNGKLSLNEGVCWVDAWAFERLVNDGLRRLDESAIGNTSELQLRLALNLYAGDFLVLESEEHWMMAPRLRLRTKFERLISALSTHLEREKRFPDAIDLCLQALELDPLNELLYRRLMNCYLKRGEFASALGTYLRCREALTKGLSAPISSETERLHHEALRAADKRSAQAVNLPPDLMVRSQSMQKRSVV